jgi:hypothetical protein
LDSNDNVIYVIKVYDLKNKMAGFEPAISL